MAIYAAFMRVSYVCKQIDGKTVLIPSDEYIPEYNHGPNLGINTDSMDNLWHPATGEHTDSKSRFRRWTKEAGLEEIGNERIKPKDNYVESGMRDSIKSDLIRAYDAATRRR